MSVGSPFPVLTALEKGGELIDDVSKSNVFGKAKNLGGILLDGAASRRVNELFDASPYHGKFE